jgi:hypothetical protein
MPGEGAATAVVPRFTLVSSNKKTERTWGKATRSLGDRLGSLNLTMSRPA